MSVNEKKNNITYKRKWGRLYLIIRLLFYECGVCNY